jgi:hypothetical protein
MLIKGLKPVKKRKQNPESQDPKQINPFTLKLVKE